ncbi:MAG: hypothetical protein ACI4UE_05215 [Candidatus Scatovivens sp.]
MIKILKKLLVCICIALIIINFTANGLSFAALDDKGIAEKVEEDLQDKNSGEFGETVTKILSGIVGILWWQVKIPAIAVVGVIQAIGGSVARSAGTATGTGILLSPDDIIFNRIYLTDINFFKTDLGGGNAEVIEKIREQIAMWYYVMRTIAIIILLLILIVVGIKMSITTVASDKAIYKKALFDWFTSLALIFVLHYLIRGVIWLNESFVSILEGVASDANMGDFLKGIRSLIFKNDFIISAGSLFIYVVITIQTLMFLISYIKRMLTLAFLVIISPLITITYSIDKMGDQKAQALNTWLKEFVYNVLIQPFHCILYIVFVSIAIKAVNTWGSLSSMLLAILCIKFVWDGEKIVRKIFGFEQASSLGAVAASGAILGSAIQKARSAGSNVKSGVKFAKNTKTGQAIKKKISENKEMRGLSHKGKKQYKNEKKNGASQERLDEIKNNNKSAFKKASDRVAGSTPIRKMKKATTKASNKAKNIKGAISGSKIGKAIGNVKNNEIVKAIGQDAKKFTRKLVSPEKVAKVGAAVMASAAMYALPEQNLITAVGAGYAAGKSAETGVRNLKERKKESFEDNVMKAYERHCAINNVPPEKRTKENFDTWYNNAYLKGKNMDAYSPKSMNKEQKEATKDLQKLGLDSSDIDSIIAQIQKAVLSKDSYKHSEMFSGYTNTNTGDEISAAAIAAAVAGYATKYNESNVYENASAYNDQMSPFGITHEDAISGISQADIDRNVNVSDSEYVQTVDEEYRQYVSEDLEEARKNVDDSNTGEILDKLQSIVDTKMETIKSDIESIKGELQSNLSGIVDTNGIVSQIESSMKSAMSSGMADMNSVINSTINSLNLTGAAKTNATQYAEKFVEQIKTVKEIEFVEKVKEVKKETDKQQIIKMVGTNN